MKYSAVHVLIVLAVALAGMAYAESPKLILVCSQQNDLFRVLDGKASDLERFDEATEAIQAAPVGAGVLVLADEYPETTTELDPSLFAAAAAKDLRLYVEYPSQLPGLEVGPPKATTKWERAAVAADVFGDDLEVLRILGIHGCHFVPVEAENAAIVMARIAGFDTAVYGLPKETAPILFEHPRGDVLVGTTKLSQFVTARYAPADAWKTIWDWILRWATRSEEEIKLEWTSTVRSSFEREEALPKDVELQAQHRGTQWFFNADLFPEIPLLEHKQSTTSTQPEAVEFGSQGMREGVLSEILADGSQPQLGAFRNDCMGEGTMALAFDAVLHQDERSRRTSLNLGNFIYFGSEITKGARADAASPAYGLMSWNTNQSFGVFYGDDNARSMLGALAASALLDVDQWDQKIMRCLLANLRTTGRLGFRGRRVEQKDLIAQGWRAYYDQESTHYAPHYEGYMWACFLWAYGQTGFEPFLERTETALRMCMEVYPDQWKWTNGLQQERARILLPLAWLVRVDDTLEHREWLRRIAEDLVKTQDACGAIREELGTVGKGSYAPPVSNEAYGTNEAPLIQENTDALSDMLYTTNFAFLGLHEAAAATGDAFYRDAEDRLAKFLCRIQIRSEVHPQLDGGWFRAFDFKRWEYWASNADAGWGAWSIESGWTNGWISGVLGLRQLDTSFWELTKDSTIERNFDALHAVMFKEGQE
jgi:hypothetical protein